ncbi:hypothetical protein VTK73DRAFT_1634 [Phialemonium thermophilum]|uniref:Uncharacterized protein n=1 Tax=Phialemonium thermophilum TaxID=223376 RepID=A0ABR3VT72_9PEZI
MSGANLAEEHLFSCKGGRVQNYLDCRAEPVQGGGCSPDKRKEWRPQGPRKKRRTSRPQPGMKRGRYGASCFLLSGARSRSLRSSMRPFSLRAGVGTPPASQSPSNFRWLKLPGLAL